jgi:hypothetical protein
MLSIASQLGHDGTEPVKNQKETGPLLNRGFPLQARGQSHSQGCKFKFKYVFNRLCSIQKIL